MAASMDNSMMADVNNDSATAPGSINMPTDSQQLWSDARSSIFKGMLVLLAAACFFGIFVLRMPSLKAEEIDLLMHNFPPTSLPAVISVRDTLLGYAETYPLTVATGILLLYVIMQTFAIPGTISLSLLSGALYGSTRGFVLIAAVSTAGACCCYGMSCLLWRPVARALWAQKLEGFRGEVAKRNHELLSYIIFLRVTPMLPNVFINVASPIVGVPLLDFLLGTLIGCAPNNFMAAHAGDHLSDLDSLADLYNPRMLLLGLTVGCVALLPVYVKHRHESKERSKERAMAMLAQKIR